MGGPTKGSEEERQSLTNAIIRTRSLISSAVRKAIERILVFFAMATLPHSAPQIYMAYKLYNHTKSAIRAYEEYTELSKTMTKKEAVATETKRVAMREGVKQVVSEEMISKIVSAQVAALIARHEFKKLTNDDEQVKYMLHATLCQFMIGAIVGSRDSLVQQASGLIR